MRDTCDVYPLPGLSKEKSRDMKLHTSERRDAVR